MGELGEGGCHHDGGGNGTTESCSGENRTDGRLLLAFWSVDLLGLPAKEFSSAQLIGQGEGTHVVGCVVPEERDVEDPNAVEVDQQVHEGAGLVEGLVEHLVPFDLVKFHKALGGWDVDESGLHARGVVSSVCKTKKEYKGGLRGR